MGVIGVWGVGHGLQSRCEDGRVTQHDPAARSTTTLADRYGTGTSRSRPVVLGALAVVVVLFLGWVVWAAWFHGTPDVTSELTRYEVVDEHTVEATLVVRLAEGATASCRIRASAADHTTVGELSFTPRDGANEVTVRTERRASAVEGLGCTTADQPQAR